ncbi:hypothetical protein [Sphingomonas psychrotolerans]|uniref:Uncharacterized protein n=1 Tax=Sphingomonas psychrotolerans TaxID=1327635 RepID=A0A2K8MH69_9SPHN|nr:hypothetical protein [Sphingomonas psychrotolerans]ATY31886.1 hypothetical protein CVN68_07795 [Sphingomonas psychrotolerans]
MTTRPAQIGIVVKVSPASNDHEARVLIDGVDWLGTDALGLDPPDLAAELLGVSPRIRVGRCACGAEGCDDRVVDRSELGEVVTWIGTGRTLLFDRTQYLQEIERFVNDQSWRPIERQVEQAAETIFRGALLEDRLAFQWASARIAKNLVHLSFQDGDEQRLLEFSWDGNTVESAVDRGREFWRERFDH